MLKNTYTNYGSVSKFFHWLIFLLLLGMVTFGYCLGWVPDTYAGFAYNIHKCTGVLILALVIIRLGWKWVNVSPALPPTTPRWQVMLDKAVQALLYIFIIAMPLVGWIGASAGGKPPHIGGLPIAFPIAQSKLIAKNMFELHNYFAIIIIILFCIHVLASLYHYYVKKDQILQRMMPGYKV